MRKILVVGMLGILLLVAFTVQPATASHQKISLPAIPAVSHGSLFEELPAWGDYPLWVVFFLFISALLETFMQMMM